jgi:hypothetical protein
MCRETLTYMYFVHLKYRICTVPRIYNCMPAHPAGALYVKTLHIRKVRYVLIYVQYFIYESSISYEKKEKTAHDVILAYKKRQKKKKKKCTMCLRILQPHGTLAVYKKKSTKKKERMPYVPARPAASRHPRCVCGRGGRREGGV